MREKRQTPISKTLKEGRPSLTDGLFSLIKQFLIPNKINSVRLQNYFCKATEYFLSGNRNFLVLISRNLILIRKILNLISVILVPITKNSNKISKKLTKNPKNSH